MKISLKNKMETYIRNLPPGTVFAISDFATIASPKTASKTLERLCKQGLIKKVLRGIFWVPDNISSSPEENNVAKALARSNNWKLVPSGKTALHVLGIIKDKPEKWTYITDGTYREYSYDGKEIKFQHTTGKSYNKLSSCTALLVQGIKAYGHDQITEEIRNVIVKNFKKTEEIQILKECKNIPAWISNSIKYIFAIKTTS